MSDPLISVLMPVYNAERYVAEAVESILAQTYRDFEFLIVDDGSTDGSLEILRRYEARDARIRLVSRPNTGYVVALNEMLGRARGDLLARMDADDVSLPDRFALQVDFLSNHPEVLCLGGCYTLIDAEGRELYRTSHPTDDAAIQRNALDGLETITHPTAMMRREAVLLTGGYRAEAYLAEDLDLWLRLGERGRLANLAQVVLKYREHGNSVSDLYQERQLAVMTSVMNAARYRRGIAERCSPPAPFRSADSSRASRHRSALTRGWQGFGRGNRLTALHYGMRAVHAMPWRPDGWRLLVCSLIKRPARIST